MSWFSNIRVLKLQRNDTTVYAVRKGIFFRSFYDFRDRKFCPHMWTLKQSYRYDEYFVENLLVACSAVKNYEKSIEALRYKVIKPSELEKEFAK